MLRVVAKGVLVDVQQLALSGGEKPLPTFVAFVYSHDANALLMANSKLAGWGH